MHLLALMSRMWTAINVKTLANNSILLLSFARSSHFDPKKTQGSFVRHILSQYVRNIDYAANHWSQL